MHPRSAMALLLKLQTGLAVECLGFKYPCVAAAIVAGFGIRILLGTLHLLLFTDSTNMDDMEKADETLMKLWRQGQEDFKVLRRRLGETGERRPPAHVRYGIV